MYGVGTRDDTVNDGHGGGDGGDGMGAVHGDSQSCRVL